MTSTLAHEYSPRGSAAAHTQYRGVAVNPVSGMRGVNRPANCYVSSLAPYACHNEECPEYNLVKIIVLEEAGPSLLIEPRLICSVCSCVVPRVVWAVLDK